MYSVYCIRVRILWYCALGNGCGATRACTHAMAHRHGRRWSAACHRRSWPMSAAASRIVSSTASPASASRTQTYPPSMSRELAPSPAHSACAAAARAAAATTSTAARCTSPTCPAKWARPRRTLPGRAESASATILFQPCLAPWPPSGGPQRHCRPCSC